MLHYSARPAIGNENECTMVSANADSGDSLYEDNLVSPSFLHHIALTRGIPHALIMYSIKASAENSLFCRFNLGDL